MMAGQGDDFTRDGMTFTTGPERVVLQDRGPASPSPDPVEPVRTFGEGSNFDYGSTSEDFRSGPTRVYYPLQNPLQQIEICDEVYRKERRIRITGTGGAYVDFMRVEEIGFKVPVYGPGGAQYEKFLLLRMRNMPETE